MVCGRVLSAQLHISPPAPGSAGYDELYASYLDFARYALGPGGSVGDGGYVAIGGGESCVDAQGERVFQGCVDDGTYRGSVGSGGLASFDASVNSCVGRARHSCSFHNTGDIAGVDKEDRDCFGSGRVCLTSCLDRSAVSGQGRLAIGCCVGHGSDGDRHGDSANSGSRGSARDDGDNGSCSCVDSGKDNDGGSGTFEEESVVSSLSEVKGDLPKTVKNKKRKRKNRRKISHDSFKPVGSSGLDNGVFKNCDFELKEKLISTRARRLIVENEMKAKQMERVMARMDMEIKSRFDERQFEQRRVDLEITTKKSCESAAEAGFAETVVSGSVSSGTTISPNSSISVAEEHRLRSKLADTSKRLSDLQGMLDLNGIVISGDIVVEKEEKGKKKKESKVEKDGKGMEVSFSNEGSGSNVAKEVSRESDNLGLGGDRDRLLFPVSVVDQVDEDVKAHLDLLIKNKKKMDERKERERYMGGVRSAKVMGKEEAIQWMVAYNHLEVYFVDGKRNPINQIVKGSGCSVDEIEKYVFLRKKFKNVNIKK